MKPAADPDTGLPALLTLQPMAEVGAVLAVFSVGHVPEVMNAIVPGVAVDVVDLMNGPRTSAPGVDNPAITGLNALAVPGQMNAPATLIRGWKALHLNAAFTLVQRSSEWVVAVLLPEKLDGRVCRL